MEKFVNSDNEYNIPSSISSWIFFSFLQDYLRECRDLGVVDRNIQSRKSQSEKFHSLRARHTCHDQALIFSLVPLPLLLPSSSPQDSDIPKSEKGFNEGIFKRALCSKNWLQKIVG